MSAPSPVYSLKVYEELYAVDEVAKSKWQERLAGAKTNICIGIARAFGVDIPEGVDPCDAVKNIPADQFIAKLATPASQGWVNFFGAENERVRLASAKMRAKLATAAPLYAQRVSDALKNYFVDRVANSVDKWVQRMITIRFVGDPPHTPYGPAPYLALRITGETKAANYRPPHAQESGEVRNYLTDWARMYIRPAIIATLVQYGVLAKYFMLAGLEDDANAILQQLSNIMNDVLGRNAAEGYTIQFAAGFENVNWSNEPMVYFSVTVTPASTGG